MPFKRKRSGSARRRFKRRRIGLRSRIVRQRWKNQIIVHRYKRSYLMEEFVLSAAVAKSYQFTFNLLPNNSEFSALYDSYRVSKWVVKLYYSATENPTNSTYVNSSMVGWAWDENEATTVASMDVLRQYRTFQMRPAFRCSPWSRICRPKCGINVYNGAGTAFSTPKFNPWVSTDVLDVPHYGTKLYFEAPSVTTMKVTIVGTVYFACKNTK